MWAVKVAGSEGFDWEWTFSDEAQARAVYSKLRETLLDEDGISNYVEITIHGTAIILSTDMIKYVWLRPPKQ